MDTVDYRGFVAPYQWFRLNEFASKLPWLQIASDGVPELILDNHMMQTFRACPARFFLEFVDGYGGKGRFWFLDFGIIVHKLIEVYYTERRERNFDLMDWAFKRSKYYWDKMNMDQEYSTHPDYLNLGGQSGLAALLLQYAQFFNAENERFRVIGAELYFGRGKEVPLLNNHQLYSFAPFRLYLSGKIDLLVDDGYNIGPMDHKTSKDFRGRNPANSYEVQEGMTGYVYAAQKLLQTALEANNLVNYEVPTGRQCNKIWMNFLQVKPAKVMTDRFKRIPLFKTDFQLEEYRQRMISTASEIFNYLINPDRTPYYNTFICNNYMHNDCAFLPVHRQSDKAAQLLTLESLFTKKPIWNPENREEI